MGGKVTDWAHRDPIDALRVAGDPLLCTAQVFELDDGQVGVFAGAGTLELVRLHECGVAGVLLYHPHLPAQGASALRAKQPTLLNQGDGTGTITEQHQRNSADQLITCSWPDEQPG